MKNTPKWSRYFNAQLSSLKVLDLTGNTNWTIPEEVLKLPTLREIRGAAIGKGCPKCTLIKDYQTDSSFTFIRYVPEQGYVLRNICIEQEFILHRTHRTISRNRFFPTCIVNDKSCRNLLGMHAVRNRCLELGSSILLTCILLGVLAIAVNVVVLVVISAAESLRKKTSMILAASLSVSDILIAIYAVFIGTVYQVLTPENFQSKLIQVCPYLGFLAIAGFSFTGQVSLLMTIEKYLVIVLCLKPHLHMRTKSTTRCLLVAAAVALILATWALFTPNMYEGREICLPFYGFNTKQDAIFGLTVMCVSAGIYIATFALYFRIFITARKSGTRLGIHRETQLLKRIGLLVGTNLLLGFVPFLVVFAGASMLQYGELEYDVWIVGGIYLPVFFGCINSLVNPFLYSYRNPKFKQVLKRKWEHMRPKKTRDKPSRNPEHADPVVIVNFREIQV